MADPLGARTVGRRQAVIRMSRAAGGPGGFRADARVIIVPDGALHEINFETLVVDGPRRHYWIDDVQVEIAPSLATPHDRGGSGGKGHVAAAAGRQRSGPRARVPGAGLRGRRDVSRGGAFCARCRHQARARARVAGRVHGREARFLRVRPSLPPTPRRISRARSTRSSCSPARRIDSSCTPAMWPSFGCMRSW